MNLFQDDFYAVLNDIDRLFKNINEKLNLWVHFKKNQVRPEDLLIFN